MDRLFRNRIAFYHLPALLAAFIAGLASSRMLFEWQFPGWALIGRPAAVIAIGLAAAASCWMLWINKRPHEPIWKLSLPLAPLLLNLIYLFSPTVDLIRSRMLFLFAIWLMSLLAARQQCRQELWPRMGILFVLAALLPVYLSTMPHYVGQADTFEFQVTAPQLGIAHPTGYPLYLLLGRLFTLLPIGSVAFRLNFGSVVYALSAASLIYLISLQLLKRPVPAVMAAVALGLSPTFWSQAIEAEVYALHAVVVSATLYVLVKMTTAESAAARERLFLFAAVLTGLGLTNHLTTVFVVPAAILLLLMPHGPRKQPPRQLMWVLSKGALFGLLPLTLYAYLPIRWLAVTGESMGIRRFVDWVVGGRFQDALQWGAWLNDPTRYRVVGRLFLTNWGWLGIGLVLLGFIYILKKNKPFAAALLLTWFGFTFYALNYYVPDLDVFLIPAQLVMALSWAAGGASLLMLGRGEASLGRFSADEPRLILLMLSFTPMILQAISSWGVVDQSHDDGLTHWGTAVLSLPLAEGSAILADSEKIAPLYYLQQAEGIRPDLDIMVLPDENSYRTELDSRINAGQTVYLARFLPGLEGIYYLRSAGPLTEVSRAPLSKLPPEATAADISFDSMRLVGYTVEPVSPFDPEQLTATLYWQAEQSVDELLQVYVRLSYQGQPEAVRLVSGQHAVDNYYPTLAWRPGEVVVDFHQLTRPVSSQNIQAQLEVALAPPFTPFNDLVWQPVTAVSIPSSKPRVLLQPLRAQIGTSFVTGVDYPEQTRPQADLPVLLSGSALGAEALQLQLSSAGSVFNQADRRATAGSGIRPSDAVMSFQLVDTALENGQYALTATDVDGRAAICGWMARWTAGCEFGQVKISGVPLPDGAFNYDDQIALLEISVRDPVLNPGGLIELSLVWQSLQSIEEDYTVFIQVVDAGDRIVGQIDSWPVQGTRPTSQWEAGEKINDPYRVQLDPDMPPGEYRMLVGWYLLGTVRRLPLIDTDGLAVDDKVVVPGLQVP